MVPKNVQPTRRESSCAANQQQEEVSIDSDSDSDAVFTFGSLPCGPGLMSLAEIKDISIKDDLRTPSSCPPFLILATDGVWSEVTSLEASKLVAWSLKGLSACTNESQKQRLLDQAARTLVQAAQDHPDNSDDITAIIIVFLPKS